jgi:hypothetical protein
MVLAAMAASMPYQRLAQIMGIHPTVAELIPTIASELSAPRSPSTEGMPELAVPKKIVEPERT